MRLGTKNKKGTKRRTAMKNRKLPITTKDIEKDPAIQEEIALLEAQELIAGLMKKQGINNRELSRKMGVSPPYITQMLSSGRNLTIRTLSKALFHLNSKVSFQSKSLLRLKKLRQERKRM